MKKPADFCQQCNGTILDHECVECGEEIDEGWKCDKNEGMCWECFKQSYS
jgi:uncharacterized protein with PIN domain